MISFMTLAHTFIPTFFFPGFESRGSVVLACVTPRRFAVTGQHHLSHGQWDDIADDFKDLQGLSRTTKLAGGEGILVPRPNKLRSFLDPLCMSLSELAFVTGTGQIGPPHVLVDSSQSAVCRGPGLQVASYCQPDRG